MCQVDCDVDVVDHLTWGNPRDRYRRSGDVVGGNAAAASACRGNYQINIGRHGVKVNGLSRNDLGADVPDAIVDVRSNRVAVRAHRALGRRQVHQECRCSVRLPRPEERFIDWLDFTDVHYYARIAPQRVHIAIGEDHILGGKACRIDRPIENNHEAIEHHRAVRRLERVINKIIPPAHLLRRGDRTHLAVAHARAGGNQADSGQDVEREVVAVAAEDVTCAIQVACPDGIDAAVDDRQTLAIAHAKGRIALGVEH